MIKGSLAVEVYVREFERCRRWAARFLPDAQARLVARSSLMYLFYAGCKHERTMFGPHARLYWLATIEVKMLCGALDLHCPVDLEGSFPLSDYQDHGRLCAVYTALGVWTVACGWSQAEQADIRQLIHMNDPEAFWVLDMETWLSSPGPGRDPLRRVFDLLNSGQIMDDVICYRIDDARDYELEQTSRWIGREQQRRRW